MLVEIITGLGVAMGISVGALLTQDMAGTELSGVAQSGAVIGGALMALPASALMQRAGRRPGLALCYLVGAVGGLAVLGAAVSGSIPLLFLGFFLFGSGNAGKLAARYAAVDLAPDSVRGRHLSFVVWATTVGAVIGPNLAAPLGNSLPGVPTLAAPFGFAAAAFLVGALLILLFLRPDPLLLAGQRTEAPMEKTSLAIAWRAVLASPGARLGITATSIGHLVMVAVMSMTPLHIGETHSPADTLRIVGFVISAHIAGMYGLSPVVGWLTDKIGRRPVILGGVALLVAACAIAGTSGHDTPQLTAALILLGLGWSCTMVAGSTLFAESVPVFVKARAQGLSDLATGLTGASAGLVSGVIVGLSGYPALTLIAAIATLPLLALALRPVPA
ncbi:MAG TPA: MFS transporter [Micromonosporaceae bacterium]|nr:MFS transporter [Micromonosporaceae bacterium]